MERVSGVVLLSVMAMAVEACSSTTDNSRTQVSDATGTSSTGANSASSTGHHTASDIQAGSDGTGTGAHGETNTEAGTGSSEGPQLGWISAGRRFTGQGAGAQLIVRFVAAAAGNAEQDITMACPTRNVGACSVSDCSSTSTPSEPGTEPRLHAGKIQFTFDTGFSTELLPEEDNRYPVPGGLTFAGGELITFSAEGGTVEAFSGQMQLPLAPIILNPSIEGDGVDRIGEIFLDPAQDFQFEWDARDSSERILLRTNARSDEPTFTCAFDAATGVGVIPAEALSAVASGIEIQALGFNQARLDLEAGFLYVSAYFEMVNEQRNASPVFIVG